MSWYRGNFHTHTTRSNDGKATPQEACDWYRKRGYDFLALTDHDHVANEADYQSPDGLLVIRGVEVSGNHLVALDVSQAIDKHLPVQEKINQTLQQGGFCIVAHPNWQFDHWPLQLLESTNGYLGLEIYNSHVSVLKGSGYALDKWDKLLSQGRKVWGVASDDMHNLESGLAGCGWVVASAPDLSLSSLRKALEQGDFYASTGIELESLEIRAEQISVVAPAAEEILFIGRGGEILERVQGSSAVYSVRGNEQYIRAECHGANSAAYTQPVFLSSWRQRELPVRK